MDQVAPNRAPNGNLCLKLISRLGLIGEKAPGKEGTFVSNFQIALATSDDEVYRIRNAINHLLKLKGAKIHSDDLFKN